VELDESYMWSAIGIRSVIRVGLLGLDSSHPAAFADYFAECDEATIAAIWDGGAVRSAEYVETFGERHDAVVYDDPGAMADAVDAAMVLTVDWDTHRRLAVPFLDAGVPTFVDKPLAGRLDDVDALAAAAADTPLTGGSAIPFHPAIASFPPDRADRTLYCVGYDHPFYYGAHLIDTARRLASSDWRAVSPELGPGTVGIAFENGTRAAIQLDGSEDDTTFGFLDVSDRTRTCTIDGDAGYDAMYGRFLDRFLDAARNGHGDGDRLLDGASLLLAVSAALDTGDRITPGDDTLRRVHADGAAFLDGYGPYY
jgi:hypothetical protein